MNHPKGEESTAVGESCSLTYHLSSTVLNCGGTQAPKHCGRGGHLRDGACAAGSVSFLLVLGGVVGSVRFFRLVGRVQVKDLHPVRPRLECDRESLKEVSAPQQECIMFCEGRVQAEKP